VVAQHRLGQLRFRDRRGHLQQGLTGEHHASLGHRPDVTGEPHPRERTHGLLAVSLGPAQVIRIVSGEREILQEPEAVFQVGVGKEPTVGAPAREECLAEAVRGLAGSFADVAGALPSGT
jgi:hypothetical protein